MSHDATDIPEPHPRDPGTGAVWSTVPFPASEPGRYLRHVVDQVGAQKAWPPAILAAYQADITATVRHDGAVGAGEALTVAQRWAHELHAPGADKVVTVAESMAHAQSAQQSQAYERGGLVLPGIGDTSTPEGGRRLKAAAAGVAGLALAGLALYTAPVWLPFVRRL